MQINTVNTEERVLTAVNFVELQMLNGNVPINSLITAVNKNMQDQYFYLIIHCDGGRNGEIWSAIFTA